MQSLKSIQIVLHGLSLLVVLLILTACVTPTTALDTEARLAYEVCDKAWKNVTYDSKNDTQETIDSARANNRSRTAYCAGTEGVLK